MEVCEGKELPLPIKAPAKRRVHFGSVQVHAVFDVESIQDVFARVLGLHCTTAEYRLRKLFRASGTELGLAPAALGERFTSAHARQWCHLREYCWAQEGCTLYSAVDQLLSIYQSIDACYMVAKVLGVKNVAPGEFRLNSETLGRLCGGGSCDSSSDDGSEGSCSDDCDMFGGLGDGTLTDIADEDGLIMPPVNLGSVQ